MKYRKDKYGNDISVLGFGCMRFPRKGPGIDHDETARELRAAYDAGVNYYDTAYIYSGSEEMLGRILKEEGIRDSVYIADKLPHYLIRNRDALDKYFSEQLKRLQTDHIDYYLMHMLNDPATWDKLLKMGITEWIDEKKASGQIRQLGFSYHGNTDLFKKLIDAYDWDFAQIQYNYMDENSQAGVEGLRYAAGKGIPIVIMEPLRGGKLVSNIPADAMRVFNEYEVKHTPAQWAFRWLIDQPEVTCVLSGMNSMEMLKDNISTFSNADAGELTASDKEMLQKVLRLINAGMYVKCTGCGYCMPCPQNVDIPGTFAAYNLCASEGKAQGRRQYLMTTALRKDSTAASRCIKCGKCEQHCPQSISIREELAKASKVLESPVYKIASKGVKVLHLYG